MDRRRLRPPDDVQRNGLMGIAAQTFDFEIEVTGIECIAQRRGRLRRSLKAEHTLVPCLARQTIGGLPRLGRLFGGSPNRCAVNAFPRLGAQRHIKAGRAILGKYPIIGEQPTLIHTTWGLGKLPFWSGVRRRSINELARLCFRSAYSGRS
jgi:hypothetical protein